MASFIERTQAGNVYLFFEAAPGPHMLLLCTERRTGPTYPQGEGDPGDDHRSDAALYLSASTDDISGEGRRQGFDPRLTPYDRDRVIDDMASHLWGVALDLCEHGVPRHLCALGCADRRLFGGAWPFGDE